MKFHVLQHVPFEDEGLIGDWISSQQYQVSRTLLYERQKPIDVREYDVLIIMGGPMGVFDDQKHPWLADEKQYLRGVVESGKMIVGICLGAQLLAYVLNSNVRPNRIKEIGWYPVHFECKSRFFEGFETDIDTFHWHGDTFDIPADAVHLASSGACQNQGFVYQDRIIGLQFHIETSRKSLGSLIRHCGHELMESSSIQSELLMTQVFDESRQRLHTEKFMENLRKVYLDRIRPASPEAQPIQEAQRKNHPAPD